MKNGPQMGSLATQPLPFEECMATASKQGETLKVPDKWVDGLHNPNCVRGPEPFKAGGGGGQHQKWPKNGKIHYVWGVPYSS